MKKVFLTLALAAFAFAANAQFVVGGNIGFNTTGGSENRNHVDAIAAANYDFTIPGDLGNQNTLTLTILPKIGYQLNDNMQVGAQFGLEYTSTKDFSGYNAIHIQDANFEGWNSTTQNAIVIAPYFRYNLTEFGSFTVFCEAKLNVNITPNAKRHIYESAYTDAFSVNHAEVDADDETYSYKSTVIGLSVVPGLNYKLNDNISVDIYCDLLRLGFTHTNSTTVWDASVGGVADVTTVKNSYNEFDFAANVNARSVANYFNNIISVGFNYHF